MIPSQYKQVYSEWSPYVASNRRTLRQAAAAGFTIIEVLIVLAIAGLILLIVFLAVPALQRNSRDTQRKRDASRVLAAAHEVLVNNGNSIASLTGGSSGNIATTIGALSYYGSTSTNPVVAAGTATATNTETVDTITVWTGAICGSGANAGKATSTGASSRQLAVTYKLESSGGTIQCNNS